MQAALDKLAEEIRSSILAGDYAGAESLAARYLEAIQITWASLSHAEQKASLLPKHSHKLLTWARNSILVQRALTREQLAVVVKTWHYLPPGLNSIELQA